MNMPDPEGAKWKAIQTVAAVMGIAILVWHIEHRGVTGPDADAVVGVGGLGVGLKLLWQSIGKD